MKMIPIASGRMSHVGYEGVTLRIRFLIGGTYDYSPVPEDVWRDLLRTASPGHYFDDHIKHNLSYRTRKVSNG